MTAELTYQARRLAHHAALALWNGNNEIEAFLKAADWPHYEQLNYGVVLPALHAADPTRPLWPSSPSNGFAGGGAGEQGPPYIPYNRTSDTSSPLRGDVRVPSSMGPSAAAPALD